jgi:polyferredoxin
LKVGYILIVALVILIAFLELAIHWMTPWSFLTAAQLEQLQTIFTSSIATAVAGAFGRGILKDINGDTED